MIKAKPKGTKGNEEFFVLAGKKLKNIDDINLVVEDAIREVV